MQGARLARWGCFVLTLCVGRSLAAPNAESDYTVVKNWTAVAGEVSVQLNEQLPVGALGTSGVAAEGDLVFTISDGGLDFITGPEDGFHTFSGGELKLAGRLTLTQLDGRRVEIGDLVLGSSPTDADATWTLTDTVGTGDVLFEVPFRSMAQFDGHTLSWTGSIYAAESLMNRTGVGHNIVGTMTLRAAAEFVGYTREASQMPSDPTAAVGADVITGDITSLTRYGGIGSMSAYAFTTVSCNLGTVPLNWIQFNSDHPVIIQNLYRIRDLGTANSRIEQIGMAWLKHGFCALQQGVCSTAQNPCTPFCGGCCNHLGLFCSDPYVHSLNADQTNLGPRSDINAATGQFPYPYTIGFGQTGNDIYKRLQVRNADLEPDLNPNSLYVMEGMYVARDDTIAVNNTNNASYRRVALSEPTPNFYVFSNAGTTQRMKAAVIGWDDFEPSVNIVHADIANDGRMTLGYKVSDLGGGNFRYEYALYNMTSHRSGQSFSVPVPPGVTISNLGFHDVDYHSGEAQSTADWTSSVSGGAITWSTETFAQNANANALRWSTTYNFRFTANSPPQNANATIGLFRTGTPNSVEVAAQGPSLVGPVLVHGADDTSFEAQAFGGYIDPRMESSNGTDLDLGLRSFRLEFSEQVFRMGGGAVVPASFEVSHTGSGAAPTVMAVDSSGNPSILVMLDRPITLQEWTTIRALVQNASGQAIPNQGNLGGEDELDRVDVGFLPCDADNNGTVQPLDLLRFRQMLSGAFVPTTGVMEDYADMDRNGDANPLDLLRYRQLLIGTSPGTQAWAGQSMNHARP